MSAHRPTNLPPDRCILCGVRLPVASRVLRAHRYDGRSYTLALCAECDERKHLDTLLDDAVSEIPT